MMRHFLIFTFFLFLTMPVQAQNEALPEMPDALQLLVERGAQVRYLGTKFGMAGWIAIYQGQEQYYYVTPDNQGFVMGLLFDKDGKMTTLEQVRQLQAQGDNVLDLFAADRASQTSADDIASNTNQAFEYKTPAERLYTEVENSNWVQLGRDDAPVIYSFVDPQCPHCHEFLNDLRRDYIESGLIQVRLVPVGFREDTLAQAAFLIAAPDAQERWFKHLDGDAAALPAKTDINTNGAELNMALMQSWKFNVTPLTVYRSRNGDVKLVRGRARDLANILADLPS